LRAYSQEKEIEVVETSIDQYQAPLVATISRSGIKESVPPSEAELVGQETSEDNADNDSQQPTPIIEKNETSESLQVSPTSNGAATGSQKIDDADTHGLSDHLRNTSISSNCKQTYMY
jgi:hypothetical protein